MKTERDGEEGGPPGAVAVESVDARHGRAKATGTDLGARGTRAGQETEGGASERTAGPRNSAGSDGLSEARAGNTAPSAVDDGTTLMEETHSKGTADDGIQATPSAGPVGEPAASARITQETSESPPLPESESLECPAFWQHPWAVWTEPLSIWAPRSE